MTSRSRATYRGAWSQGNASRICCRVHSCVGCSVTSKCTTRAIAPRKRTVPGRSPSARQKNRCPRSVPVDPSGSFAKSGKAVCGAKTNIWPPWIVPPQSQLEPFSVNPCRFPGPMPGESSAVPTEGPWRAEASAGIAANRTRVGTTQPKVESPPATTQPKIK